jgi:hypothetical protein
MSDSDASLPLSVLTALDEYRDAAMTFARDGVSSREALSARAALLHSLREMAADTARLDWLQQARSEVLPATWEPSGEPHWFVHDGATSEPLAWDATVRGALQKARDADAARTPQPETRP